jgi:hypothetical protein
VGHGRHRPSRKEDETILNVSNKTTTWNKDETKLPCNRKGDNVRRLWPGQANSIEHGGYRTWRGRPVEAEAKGQKSA